MDNFKDIKHFSPKEFTHPELMDREHLLKLDSFRGYLGTEIIITSSTGGQHTKDSWHYKGYATDIVVPKFNGSLFSLYLITERFNFTGIGLYNDWSYNNLKIGGLHIDSRPLERNQGARWIGILSVKEKENFYNYLGLTTKNLINTRILTRIGK